MAAGEMSMHDDRIVHGSEPNRSDRLRCGLTIRYSAGEVKCDTSVWPQFRAYWMRGSDRWRHNPAGTPPAGAMTEVSRSHRDVRRFVAASTGSDWAPCECSPVGLLPAPCAIARRRCISRDLPEVSPHLTHRESTSQVMTPYGVTLHSSVPFPPPAVAAEPLTRGYKTWDVYLDRIGH